MRGEDIGAWSETWRESWLPLVDDEGIPEDIFCELYRALASVLKNQPSFEVLAGIIDNPAQSRGALKKTGANAGPDGACSGGGRRGGARISGT